MNKAVLIFKDDLIDVTANSDIISFVGGIISVNVNIIECILSYIKSSNLSTIVLDLSECNYITSDFISILVFLARNNIKVSKIIGVSAGSEKILKILRVDKIFDTILVFKKS